MIRSTKKEMVSVKLLHGEGTDLTKDLIFQLSIYLEVI